MGHIAMAAIVATSLAATAASAQVALDAGRAAAAFGAGERVADASLSPDGTKVAFVSPGPGQSTVV